MGSLCNVFDNQSDAIEAQLDDYLCYLSSDEHKNASSKWREITTEWAVIKKRATDGKYYYPVCPYSDQNYRTEHYQNDWDPRFGVQE